MGINNFFQVEITGKSMIAMIVPKIAELEDVRRRNISIRGLDNRLRIITLGCSVAYQGNSSQGNPMGGLYAYLKVHSN
jgi:hypothetical protein